MNHTRGAGTIDRHGEKQSSALPLFYGRPCVLLNRFVPKLNYMGRLIIYTEYVFQLLKQSAVWNKIHSKSRVALHTVTVPKCFKQLLILSMVFQATILHCKTIYSRPGTTWDNEMKFVMNHAPCAESIARPVGQQSGMALYSGRLPSPK